MTRDFKQPNWLKLMVVTLLALGVFFRFANLDQKVYWHDEAINSFHTSGYSLNEALQELPDGHQFSPKDLHQYQYPSAEKKVFDVVKSLAISEPQNPPFFYMLSWYWLQTFDYSVATIRSLSAVLSLLIFPCIYWLCVELFQSPTVGLIAMLVAAVSPFHVLYAQEARPFSLWTVMILLSSLALLRATRKNTIFDWVLYAITLTFGLYTFPFTLFVAIGHGVYLIAIERIRFSRTTIAFLSSTFLSILAFTPWLVFIVLNSHKMDDWRSREVSLLSLVKTWIGNIVRIFFDLNFDSSSPLVYTLPSALIIIALTGYSIYFLLRNTPKSTSLFILTLIGATALALILPDLILGGRRSSASRYLIPSYLGIQLSVSYLLANQIFSDKSWNRMIWKVVTVVIFASGISSCIVSLSAETWWNKILSLENPAIARTINQSEHPLLISNRSALYELISLSYLLEPKVQIQLDLNQDTFYKPQAISEVFLFYPSNTLKRRIKAEANYSLEPLQEVGGNQFLKLIEK